MPVAFEGLSRGSSRERLETQGRNERRRLVILDPCNHYLFLTNESDVVRLDTINRAVDAGIPVVTWDADAPKSKRMAFYGVDDYKSGQIMGEEAARLLDGKGTIAIITSLGASNLRRRLDGVQSALANHPGLKIVETYD